MWGARKGRWTVARNGTWIALVLVFAGIAAGQEGLAERWDKPKRESFALEDAAPEKIAEEIRSRYGVSFEADCIGLPPLDFAAKDVTFFT